MHTPIQGGPGRYWPKDRASRLAFPTVADLIFFFMQSGTPQFPRLARLPVLHVIFFLPRPHTPFRLPSHGVPSGKKGEHLARPLMAAVSTRPCKNCATDVARGWRFCAYCGAAIGDMDWLGLDELSERAWSFATRLSQCHADAEVAGGPEGPSAWY